MAKGIDERTSKSVIQRARDERLAFRREDVRTDVPDLEQCDKVLDLSEKYETVIDVFELATGQTGPNVKQHPFWTGTLGEFLDANEDLSDWEVERIAHAINIEYSADIGGGASPAFVVRKAGTGSTMHEEWRAEAARLIYTPSAAELSKQRKAAAEAFGVSPEQVIVAGRRLGKTAASHAEFDREFGTNSAPRTEPDSAPGPSAFDCGSPLAFDDTVREHVADAIEHIQHWGAPPCSAVVNRDDVEAFGDACACLAAAARRIVELQRHGRAGLEPILDDVLCVLEFVAAKAPLCVGDADEAAAVVAMVRYLAVFAGVTLGDCRLGEMIC